MGAADYKFHSEEMKRSLLGAILCLLTVMLHVAAVSGKVATVYKGGIEWSVNTVSKTAVAVGPSDKTYGSLTNPVIPDSVAYEKVNYPVTGIGASCFTSFKSVSGTITLPKTLVYIGKGAFKNCTKLSGSLVIPDNVTRIYDEAFLNCTGLKGTLSLPTSLQEIGVSAFAQCGFKGTLELPDKLTSIGQSAFRLCEGFTGSLDIPESVTSLGSAAFSGCSGFNGSLSLSPAITEIGGYTFSGTGFKGELKIPAKVTTIGEGAFKSCTGFTGKLVIPESVASLGTYAFQECTGFSSLVLGKSLKTVGGYAFRDCSGLSGSLTIPSRVSTIKEYAFYGCSGLKGTLYLPASLQTIEPSAFTATQFSQIESLALTPPTISKYITNPNYPSDPGYYRYAFTDWHYDNTKVLVPAESLQKYKTHSVWRNFKYISALPVEPASISIDKTEMTIKVGETDTLIATVLPDTADNKSIVWTSGDESVASVDSDGNVMGIKVGETIVTATTVNGLTASCTIFVTVPVGVESFESDDSQKEIFTLSGLMVLSQSELAPGIYIVREGNTVRKLIVR